jgi:ABC-2 type transport system permease protein
LGGVFYSISLLPEFWQGVSQLNPVLYMVNVFRYGMLGVSDIDVGYAFAGVVVCILALFSYSLYLLESGKRLRN